MSNKTKVLINGQVYTLGSAESEEYMQKAALYLNKKIDELKSGNDMKKMNSRVQSILLALNIVDDLFQERKKVEEERKKHLELGKENQQLRLDLEKAKKELEDYMELLNAE